MYFSKVGTKSVHSGYIIRRIFKKSSNKKASKQIVSRLFKSWRTDSPIGILPKAFLRNSGRTADQGKFKLVDAVLTLLNIKYESRPKKSDGLLSYFKSWRTDSNRRPADYKIAGFLNSKWWILSFFLTPYPFPYRIERSFLNVRNLNKKISILSINI